MIIFNCSLREIEKYFGNKKIVFFGNGSWLSAVNYSELMRLSAQFSYVIDNDLSQQTVYLGNIELKVFSPDRVKREKECVIVLTSPVYMYEMYCQLERMDLGDGVLCCAFPFMQMTTPNLIDEDLIKKVTDEKRKEKIPKIIHSFWFSREKKPDAYQRCVDTWQKYLSNYEIKEWNRENYDCHKNPFLERAIELGAWAFATDYARLDVLDEYGGIYLDMDVEVLRPFDNLLGNDAFLSFSNHVLVDLAVVGAKRKNPLIRKMLKLYDEIELPKMRNAFTGLFQPSFVRKTLVDAGVRMDGSLQIVRDAVIMPNVFFMPQDHILFRDFKKTEYTYCVHYDNFGWSFSGDNKKEKKKKDNNLLWNIIQETGYIPK